MTTVVLIIALTISIALNVLGVWYVRKLLQSFILNSENVENLLFDIEKYEEHLTSVHSLETYYGDETLGGLMRHTEALANNLNQYREVYAIVEEEEEVDYYENETKS
tara:strand:+ start:559 stop:879 length:321 start_codon:yes stop_codon:yes gene_type:complete